MNKGSKPSRKELRSFAIGLGVLIPLVFWLFLPWWLGFGRHDWLLGAGGVLLLAGAILPTAVAPLYRVWMPVAHAIGWLNTRLILGLVFFAVITPVGLLLRALGKLQYSEAFDRTASSYRSETDRKTLPRDLEHPF